MALFIMWLGRRGYSELFETRLGDLKVTLMDRVPVLSLCKERVSKTRQGERPQHVRHGVPWLSSLEDTQRCPVNIFNKIVKMRPANAMHDDSPDSPMLLTPIDNIHGDCRRVVEDSGPWFKSSPLSQEAVGKIVMNMTVRAGIVLSNRKITNSSENDGIHPY